MKTTLLKHFNRSSLRNIFYILRVIQYETHSFFHKIISLIAHDFENFYCYFGFCFNVHSDLLKHTTRLWRISECATPKQTTCQRIILAKNLPKCYLHRIIWSWKQLRNINTGGTIHPPPLYLNAGYFFFSFFFFLERKFTFVKEISKQLLSPETA